MTEFSRDQAPNLFFRLREMVSIVQRAIGGIKRRRKLAGADLPAARPAGQPCAIGSAAPLPRADDIWQTQLPEQGSDFARYRAAALAFRNAAAIAVAECRTQRDDDYENLRLAEIFRSGKTSSIATEPALRSAAIVVELAQVYFAGRFGKNGHSIEVSQVMSALRDLLADEILHGVRPELKPDFEHEYFVFQRDYIGRCGARR